MSELNNWQNPHEGVRAKLVYDSLYSNGVQIPSEMGAPKDSQMNGTPMEQLAELAGRICYDSLGQGRDSRDYHAHIKQVGHLSVYEHCNFTVEIKTRNDFKKDFFGRVISNRPGLYWTVYEDMAEEVDVYRVTLNLRTVLEWDLYTRTNQTWGKKIGDIFKSFANILAPMIVDPPLHFDESRDCELLGIESARVADAISDDEQWVSLYLAGSRGFSHEQVRHGNFSAISQRSTRYVDESYSPWVMHPMIENYLDRTGDIELHERMTNVMNDCRELYTEIVDKLQKWQTETGIDKSTARKQSRGAARGVLGNALSTEMIFSATVSQWKWIHESRAHPAADDEIRYLYELPIFDEIFTEDYLK